MAAVFHMDPVDVFKGSDWDVAFRMAAANRHVAAVTAGPHVGAVTGEAEAGG